MSCERILVVEDDKHIAKLIKYNVERAGYECAAVSSGEDALDAARKQAMDLIVLDIMLPGMDGFEVCRLLKQDARLKAIPVIMLTARGEEIDRIVGLEVGSDDYMVKPFSPRELILRIKAVLRRRRGQDEPAETLSAGGITVNIPAHTVIVSEKRIELTPMEFKLLVILMERRGRVQTRDRLLDDVWDMSADVYTRTVDTHVKRLREKLGRAGAMIETVVGVGYRFREEDEN